MLSSEIASDLLAADAPLVYDHVYSSSSSSSSPYQMTTTQQGESNVHSDTRIHCSQMFTDLKKKFTLSKKNAINRWIFNNRFSANPLQCVRVGEL